MAEQVAERQIVRTPQTLRSGRMTFRERASVVMVIVAVGCAVVTTAITVRREFFTNPASNLGVKELPGPGSKPVHVSQWRDYAAGGHRIGAESAEVTIIEFAEFECPYCKAFALGPLRYVRQQFGQSVSLVFRQFPMPYHRFAYPAARAAECAAAQGRFEAFHDAVFAGQDSLGLKSFEEFAAIAGTPDLRAFSACATSAGPLPMVEQDIAAAKALLVRGTPTYIINGEMFVGVPDTASLERQVKAAIALVRTN